MLFNVTDDGSVSLRSLTFEGDIDFDITRPTQVREGNWGDYACDAKFALKKRFVLTKGIKGVIKGSLPIGGLAGLCPQLPFGRLQVLFAVGRSRQESPFSQRIADDGIHASSDG